MKTKLGTFLVAALLWVGAPLHLHAQLVADGGTLNLTTATNLLPGDLTVGTNGGNTTLNIIAPGTVTNANSYIGRNASSDNNTVTVQNSGAAWKSSNLGVGYDGSGNQLVISNGATVANTFAYLGFIGSSNVAVVTGAGSLWTSGTLTLGSSGNQLTVSNGATVASTNGSIGYGTSSSKNLALVTGTGSLWTNKSLYVGDGGFDNQLVVSNGATVASTDGLLGWYFTSDNNVAVVTGAGSLWTNGDTLQIGHDGGGNQLLVSDGATVSAGGLVTLGNSVGATGNSVLAVGGSLASAGLTLGNALSRNNSVTLQSGSTWDLRGGIFTWGNAGISDTLSIDGTSALTNVGALTLDENDTAFFLTNSPAGYSLNGFTTNQLHFTGQGPLVVGNSGTNVQLTIRDYTQANTFGFIGSNLNARGNSVLVTGADSLWTNSSVLYVGNSGGGSQLVVSNGATVSAANMFVGYLSSSLSNRVTVEGGNVIVTNGAGTAVFEILRGTNVLNAGLIEADQLLLTNSAGALAFNGGTLITRGGKVNNGQNFVVGASGTTAATLDVRSGTPLVVSNIFILGFNNTAAAGSRLIITNGGTLSFAGAGLISAYLGYDAASSNNVAQVTGAGSRWTNSNFLYLGYSGSGNQLVVSNGATVANRYGNLGDGFSSSNNVALISGPGSLWTNSSELFVGNSGSGNRLIVSDGATVASFGGFLGFNPPSENNMAMVTGTNSLWNTRDSLAVGVFGRGNQLIVSNGATVASALGYLGYSRASSSNNVAVVTGAGSLWTNNIELNVGYNGGGNQLIVSDGATVWASIVYVGFNTGSSNNVVRLANGTLTAPGGLTVKLNNTLAGSGIINGPVTIANGATLSPGAPLGKLVLNSSPVLQGNVVMEISKSGGTRTNDHIQVNSVLTYSGSLTVSNLGPDMLAAGDSFQLFSATGYSGAFAITNLPALPAGLKWSTPLTNGILAVVTEKRMSISGATRSGTNLVFNITDGAPGGDWDLLTATNVMLPVPSWTTSQSGIFDGLGNVTLTNSINFNEPQRYFRISVP